MTLEEIAQYTIDYASGSFHLEWHEEFENLSESNKLKVRDIVFEQVGDCYDCCWHWLYDEMETCSDGQERCWQCVGSFEDCEEIE